MKTAEQWFNEDFCKMVGIVEPKPTSEINQMLNFIKQIQLDAWKQGMCDAASFISSDAQVSYTQILKHRNDKQNI